MKHKISTVKIEDCRVDTFCAGGKGGQHQNATKSAVRVTHPPSGAVGESREERYQLVNKRRAFRRMAESDAFRKWVKLQAAGGIIAVTQAVDEAMRSEHLKIEVRDEYGQWIEVRE